MTGLISVYLDSNIWNFLFDRNIDLAASLPKEEFCIAITREAEMEIPPIPEHKADLKNFIHNTIRSCSISTDHYFGFNDDSLPQDEQRVAGFNIGRFASEDENAFLQQQKTPLNRGNKRKSNLCAKEADISLGARSFVAVVLSLDAKKDPINKAYKQGGKVVFLTDFDTSGLSLRAFILKAIGHI